LGRTGSRLRGRRRHSCGGGGPNDIGAAFGQAAGMANVTRRVRAGGADIFDLGTNSTGGALGGARNRRPPKHVHGTRHVRGPEGMQGHGTRHAGGPAAMCPRGANIEPSTDGGRRNGQAKSHKRESDRKPDLQAGVGPTPRVPKENDSPRLFNWVLRPPGPPRPRKSTISGRPKTHVLKTQV
jgi:hypothetical protein